MARRRGCWPGSWSLALPLRPMNWSSSERRPRRADPGLSDEAEGRGTLSGGRAPAHLPRPAREPPLDRRRARGWGYVALFVDDFSTRGLKETCAVDFPKASPTPMARSASSPAQPFVDATRIAAVGFSQGGDTALKIAASAAGMRAFKAAAAFYPPCANEADAQARDPDLDPRRRQGRRDSRGRLRGAGQAAGAGPGETRRLSRRAPRIRLARVRRRAQVIGMTLAYDRNAAQRARAELRGFLKAQLGR